MNNNCDYNYIPGYRAESILSTIIITSVTIFVALVSLITLTATVIVCCKKKRSFKSDEPVEPVYYSAAKPVAEEVTPDPNYDVISAVKTRRDITTEPNKAYHPVSVQPNEAYQPTNIMQPNEAYQTTNIMQPNEAYQPTNIMQPNEAYQPTNIMQPNEAYQPTNIMQPNEAYQTTNITNVN